jgi:small membrane protein
MTPFQAVALGLIAFLIILTIVAGMRGSVRKRVMTFWVMLWTSGAVLLIWPESTAIVAHKLGIGRGADLLLYSSVLVMLISLFSVYSRFRSVDRQLTVLVRRLAIERAALPGAPTPPPQ